MKDNVKIFASIIEDGAIEQIEALSKVYDTEQIRVMCDVHKGAGCTIGTTIKIKDKVTPNLVGVDIGCLDCNTEVLTPNGWIKISEYDGEEIMQFNPETNEGTFKKPLLFIKKPCDNFYHFKNSKGLDQMVSEEHNMLVYYGKKELKFYKKNPSYFNNVKSIDKGYYRFNTCFNVENKGIDLSDDLIRIDIMIQADGRIRKYDDYNFVELHFRKERKIQRAINLLEKSNIKYNLSILKDGTTNISFHISKEIDKTLKKYWNANRSQLNIVTEECLLWDGYKGYRSSYSTTIKENADVIQYAFIATNIRASIYLSKNKRPNQNDCYYVIPTKNKYVGYNIKPTIEPSIDGFKYCFTTQEGYFVCRRNDYTFITGNCGMLCVGLGTQDIGPLSEVDKAVREIIPMGMHINSEVNDEFLDTKSFKENLLCKVNFDRAFKSLGTMGGSNHFIEIDADNEGKKYLVIHTGSRHLGVEICKYYQDLAIKKCFGGDDTKQEIIKRLKAEGRECDIQEELKKIKKPDFDKSLAYLQGKDMEDYLHDMKLAQQYAKANRLTIAYKILRKLNLNCYGLFETVHNYINMDDMILRKGAVSAKKGEYILIPMNMRDGSLVCRGKGNEDWNCSAPHGAGRIMSRTRAKNEVDMDEFTKTMDGIYTTSVCESTKDESPFAYKPMSAITDIIGDTVDILKVIKPICNIKAID